MTTQTDPAVTTSADPRRLPAGAGPAPAPDGSPSWTQRLRPRPKSGPRRPLSSPELAVVIACGTLVGLAAWFIFYAFVLSGVQEAHDQRVNYAHLRQNLALATVPIGGRINPGTPVALISLPTLGQNRIVVVEGTSSKVMQAGPGHLSNSALPGQAGSSVIYGRSTTFGAPFGSIHKLTPGSSIDVDTGQGSFVYRVVDVRRPGDVVPASLSKAASVLTLETAQQGPWTRAWIPGQVLYVDAVLAKGKIQPTPAGRPTVVPKNNLPFQPDTTNLVALVLSLQLLLAFVVATAWAWRRWSKPQTWLVAVPAGLAILWLVTSAFAPLLPNLA
jgi:sortase A